jgi:rSAM/selenodomain-associated transferase 2
MATRQCALSIVVPVLNDAEPLERLLSSLRDTRNTLSDANGKRYNDLEVIVVDGGSSDGSLLVAERFADISLKTVTGRALQMNAGAAQAHGDIIWFVHADASISVELLTVLIGLQTTSELRHQVSVRQDRLTSFWGRCDVRIDHRSVIFRVIEGLMNWRSRCTAIATGDQGIFVSRDLFARIKGYANIPLMEDIEICARLRKEASPLCLRNQIGASSRRWTLHGIGKTIALMWWLRLQYFLGASPARLHRSYYLSSHRDSSRN